MSNATMPINSVAYVGAYVGIHDALKAIEALIDKIDSDRLDNDMARRLAVMSDRIRQRVAAHASEMKREADREQNGARVFPTLAKEEHGARIFPSMACGRYDSSKPNVANTPKDAQCPDGLLPDGETCPGCGRARGPSGIGGGTWVHLLPEGYVVEGEVYGQVR